MRICEMPPPSCPPGTTLMTAFSTDSDANGGGFTHSRTADEWEYGTPNSPATTTTNPLAAFIGCNCGTGCWKTDLDKPCNVSSSQDLISPNISLDGLGPPIIVSWMQRFQVESATFDHAWVDLQKAGGADPVRLFEFRDATMTAGVGSQR